MPEIPPKKQYIAALVPDHDTLETFIEKSQKIIRKAWEEKHSRIGKEKNHWDDTEEFIITDLMRFKKRRRQIEGTVMDIPPTLRSRQFDVESTLGDEKLFPKEGRGKPQQIKEQVLRIIKTTNEIDETSSNGQIVRLVQKVFRIQRKNPPSEDSIKRYARLWKIHQKYPMTNYHKISVQEWLFLVKYDKREVKNSLLMVLVPPAFEQWLSTLGTEAKHLYDAFRSSEVKKIKYQVTSIVYAVDKSKGKEQEKFGKVMDNFFQEHNTNEQVLKIFNVLLSLSGQPTS